MMCASTWRLLRKWPRMNTNFFTNKIRNSWPPGLLRPQTPRFSAVGSCQAGDGIPSRPVSRRRRCSRLTFSSLDDVRQHLASLSKMAPNEHEFHESDQKFLAPGAGYILKHRVSARWARVEPVSRRRRCSRLTAYNSRRTFFCLVDFNI